MQSSRIIMSVFAAMFVFALLVATVGAETAQCVPKLENVDILSKAEYGVGEVANNIKFTITSNVGQKVPYKAQLFKGDPADSGVEVARISSGVTDSAGNGTLNFNYEFKFADDYYIVLFVGDEVDQTEEKVLLKVRKGFDLKLSCPITNIVNKPITCTWRPLDAETGSLVAVKNPMATVTQGNIELPAPISGSQLTFTPQLPGSVNVKLEASADEYVTDVDEIAVAVSDATLTTKFLIDNVDYFQLTNVGVRPGSKKLTFIVTEGLDPADVRAIEGTITTPAGEKINMVFTKTTSGNWETIQNFPIAKQKYVLEGNIQFTSIARDPVPFIYDVITIGGASEEEQSKTTSTIIIITVIVIATVFIVGGFLWWRGKKKKRR